MSTKILVTGGNGQLGNEFRSIQNSYPDYNFIFLSKSELDITDPTQVSEYLNLVNIPFIINCAAYTAVDDAEQNLNMARSINAEGPKILAEACSQKNITLFHISTDYVFDGKSKVPYNEDDITSPLSIYGKTKLEGEQNVHAHWSKSYIIRTSWLYSSYNQNFVKSMLRLGEERSELGIVSDQFGSPTYAHDLAKAIMHIVTQTTNNQNNAPYGIYHYSNEGCTSWYEFAKEIMHIAGINCQVNPITTEQYPTPAPRPSNSVMSKEKIKEHFHLEIPHWKKSLKLCMNEIFAKHE